MLLFTARSPERLGGVLSVAGLPVDAESDCELGQRSFKRVPFPSLNCGQWAKAFPIVFAILISNKSGDFKSIQLESRYFFCVFISFIFSMLMA
jgi:hypothetical protein